MVKVIKNIIVSSYFLLIKYFVILEVFLTSLIIQLSLQNIFDSLQFFSKLFFSLICHNKNLRNK